MKVCVINGSPKGKYSITLQTVLYLEKNFPECEFEILNVGQTIRAIEKDFERVRSALAEAELLLFSYPVYTFIAPYQLHRFIELLRENEIDLSGKFAAQISTSKHFYDVTAHTYIKENCLDLGMKFVGGLSADMEDLLSERGRTEARAFWSHTLFAIKEGIYESLPSGSTEEEPRVKYEAGLEEIGKSDEFDTVIVTNAKADDVSLLAMIEDFRRVHPYKSRVVNIDSYPFSGGCLGCFNCAVDGTCIYKDGFDKYLREEIQTASAIVYAFTIKDHSMGASFKLYDDRQFCNGHRTVTMGMPIGYIINGSLSGEANLKMIIEGRADVGHNYLAGCAEVRDGIVKMSKNLSYALENKLVMPQSFYGVGGLKIFRDLIFVMRGMMRADHKFYKKHGFYDFPQKKRGTIFKMKLVGMLISNKKIKSKLGNKMNEGMTAPYKKILEAEDLKK